MKGSMVVVFDFDFTLIDCNSDPWVVNHLGAKHVMDALYSLLPWTSLMDRMMEELHCQGKTISDVEQCLRHIPLHPQIIRAIQSAHALGCELHIISDANTFFIKTVLDTHGLTNYFTGIHSNPAFVDERGVLRILPFHPYTHPPHGCPNCPPNMCKGLILDTIRAIHGPIARTIYLGDGRGDYCPSLKLGEGDDVLAREGFPLWKLLQQNIKPLRAKIHGWTSAEDVEICLLNLLTSGGSVPILDSKLKLVIHDP